MKSAHSLQSTYFLSPPPHQQQRFCLSGNSRIPDPRARARDFTRAHTRRDRDRDRRRELFRLRRHEYYSAHASAIHRRAPNRQSLPLFPITVSDLTSGGRDVLE
jgi:hypothetical protein